MNPIAGQGGMLAIEAAATFVNELSESLKHRCSKSLSNSDFDSIFARVQALCIGRAKALVKNAKNQQMVQANGHPIAPMLVFLLGYMGGLDFDLTQVAKRVLRGASLRDIPVPKRHRWIPFIDELPARPMSRLWMTKILFAGLTSLYLYQSVTESQGMAGCAGEQKRHWLLWVLGLLRTDMPLLTIWAIEGQRKGSSMSLLRW
jgi:hypothetical protein